MTAHLPEDPSDWPEDAYQLLGVDRDADLKTLRRAYTRLIRTFKPEHSPDEFQKIREAYDAVRSFAELKEQLKDSEHDWIFLSDTTTASDGHAGSTAGLSTADKSLTSDSATDVTDRRNELAKAWKAACDGDLAAARRWLEELHLRTPDDEEVISRLYWIRKLTPAESIEDLVGWLIQIVKRRGLRGRPWQLLISESSWNTRETLRDDIVDLFSSGSQIERLVPLLLLRWKRTSRVLSWKLIQTDLDQLRDRFIPDNPGAWIELLVSALQIVVWAESVPDDLLQELLDEIGEFEELHLQHSHVFDQLDELLEVRQELHRVDQFMPRATLSLIRAEQLGLDPTVGERLLNLARSWQTRPGATLGELDRLSQNCPAIFMQLLYCMSRQNTSAFYFPEGQQEVVTRLVEKFVDAADWLDVNAARLSIFNFCVHEALPLRYVVKVLAESSLPALTIESIAEHFQGDAALHCLCEAVTASNCN